MNVSRQFILIGIIVALLGVLALFNPFAASLAVTTIVGIVLLLSGVFQLWVAFAGLSHARVSTALLGLLALVAGIFMLASPAEGAVSLTLVVGAVFFIMGFARLILAWQLRHAQPFWALLVAGAASVFLGVLVFTANPVEAPTLLGILFGFQLLADGVGLVALGIMGRNLWK